jgi:DNA-binding NtrC family response regulator
MDDRADVREVLTVALKLVDCAVVIVKIARKFTAAITTGHEIQIIARIRMQ